MSSSTTEPIWQNTTVVSGDLPRALSELKNEPGEGIITYGIGPIARTLIEQGLLDEMHILVNPVLAGQGDLAEMLIREGAVARFELTDTKPLKSGVAVLSYRQI